MNIAERVSGIPTPYAVHCRGVDPECGWGPCKSGEIIYLTYKEYLLQLCRPNDRWRCPYCNAYANFDDENFDRMSGVDSGGGSE